MADSMVLVAVGLVLSLAACSDAPTAPATRDGLSAATGFAASRSRAASKAQRFKKYISGGAYAGLFGRQGRAPAGIGFPHGRGRGKIADLADVLVNNRSQPGQGQSEVSIAEHGGTLVVGFNDAAGFFDIEAGITGWAVSRDRGAGLAPQPQCRACTRYDENDPPPSGRLYRRPTPCYSNTGEPDRSPTCPW